MYKVLVVDDDENIRIFMERLLTKKFSCKVITAQNGLDALNRIKYDQPEVIFLDITMPVMDGIETLRSIREDHNLKDLPVIMLTAVSDKSIIDQVMKLGIVTYLLKPLMYDVTYQKIKEHFYQIRTKKEAAEKRNAELSKQNSEVEEKEHFLIIDTDDKFREKLKVQMEISNIVLEASNGAEGLELFIKHWPTTVCIGQNLPFMNEKLLCQKIRMLEKERGKKVTIFAIRDDINLPDEDSRLYDLVIPKVGGFPGL